MFLKFSTSTVLATIVLSSLAAAPAYSGQVTYPDNTYSTGDTLTATDLNAKFNESKTNINDNDTRITGNANTQTTHEGNAAAHHSPYTDAEATAAMSTKGNANSLNHDRYTNSEVITTMGAKGSTNPLNHDRYTDSAAINAMGSTLSTNPLNHDRYTDSEAVSAMNPLGDTNTLNHDRYTDAEAAAAVGDRIQTSGRTAQRICTGESGLGWVVYDPFSIYIDVDTSACGFSTTPTHFTSLSGDADHYVLTGVNSIYFETSTGFRVYVYNTFGSNISPTTATTYNWKVKWMAVGN